MKVGHITSIWLNDTFRCVEAVNFTHNPVHAQMDVKLRSLICLGLNEQVLHLWLESLASNEEVVRKWLQS